MRGHRMVMIIWAVAATLAVPGVAQDVGTETQTTALEGIDRSLKQIVKLLRIQIGNQRAELAVQRLDIARRDLIARERELRDAEATRDTHLQQQQDLQARVASFGTQTAEETGMDPESFDYMRKQEELQAESLKQAIWRSDQQIIDLRNEIVRVREDLDVWEKLVSESFVPD